MTITTRFHDAAGRTLTAGMLAKLNGHALDYGAPCPNSPDPRQVIRDMRRREKPAPVFVWPKERKPVELPLVAMQKPEAREKPQDAQTEYVDAMQTVRRMAMAGRSQGDIGLATGLRRKVVGDMIELMGIYDKWRAAVRARERRAGRKRHSSVTGAIIRAVSAETGVPAVRMEGQSRKVEYVRARHVAMYLAREVARVSFDAIGAAFEGRDHTTVMDAVRKIEAALDQDGELAALVRRCKARIGVR